MSAADDGVAVVGAGHIGLPWAAVLAVETGVPVRCVDVDEERVAAVNEGRSPFDEPGLNELVEQAVDLETLRATTDPSAVADARLVAFTINARRNRMSQFLSTVREYASLIEPGTVVVNRTTLPVGTVSLMRSVVQETVEGRPSFVTFPERLAEGKAIEEIRTLPKIIGVDDERGRTAMTGLLEPLNCELEFTDPETAMFVKLIDNSYRDALFAISNQIAFTADQLGLDAHRAIELANHDYPRNNIPSPGTVGGKCLPKDPHFLTDEQVCDQPTTPDLFNAARRTNAALESYVTTRLLRLRPSKAAMLGLSYKRGIGDTFNSPSMAIRDALEAQGVPVESYDPHVQGYDDLRGCLLDADVVVLGVDHPEFEGIEPSIDELATNDAVVYDLWGVLDEDAFGQAYTGFGIPQSDGA